MHNHDHHHEVHSNLSFKEKLIKLLEHWIKHNEDHAGTYTDWANKAKVNDMNQASVFLEDATEMTLQINKKFLEALILIKNEG